LVSEKDGNIYIGHTDNLEKRFKAHNAGKVFSTKSRKLFVLGYFEVLNSRKEAILREKYLKSGCGREFVKAKAAVS